MTNATTRERDLLSKIEDLLGEPLKVTATYYGWRKSYEVESVGSVQLQAFGPGDDKRWVEDDPESGGWGHWERIPRTLHPIRHRVVIDGAQRDAVTRVLTSFETFYDLRRAGGTFGPTALEIILANTVEFSGGEPYRLAHEGPEDYSPQRTTTRARHQRRQRQGWY